MVETRGDSGSISGPRQISLTLSGLASGLLLLLYTLLYVLPLYASKRTRPSPTLSRDSPLVIRARITSVTVSTALCSVLTFLIISARSDDGSGSGSVSPLRAMGYWPLGLWDALRSLALVALLFAGPLYEALVVYGMWRDWTTLQPLYDIWHEWTSWRNIVVGPVTEELLFRSAAVPLLVGAGVSLGKIVFLTPIIFGLAHIHHFYEFRLTHPHVPVIAAVARSLLQLTYTTLFGAYATFIFLRTGSLLAIITVHAFCNAMGLPRFWGHVQPYWMYPGQQSWKWTSLYYALLVSGSVAWWWQLWPLSESSNALASW